MSEHSMDRSRIYWDNLFLPLSPSRMESFLRDKIVSQRIAKAKQELGKVLKGFILALGKQKCAKDAAIHKFKLRRRRALFSLRLETRATQIFLNYVMINCNLNESRKENS